MEDPPRIAVLSSSWAAESRSRALAELCLEECESAGGRGVLLDLREHALPPFDDDSVYRSESFARLHEAISAAEGIVLASPVYNWGCAAELKRIIEATGSTDAARGVRSAWFDKVVTFVNAAGLPHSYMAFAPLANSLMMDFKCIVNPYNVYVHNRHWSGDDLAGKAAARVRKSMRVMLELTVLLRGRTYRSDWESYSRWWRKQPKCSENSWLENSATRSWID